MTRIRRVSAPLRAAAVLLVAGSLSGCALTMLEDIDFGIESDSAGADRGYEANNPIKVRPASRILDLPVNTLDRPDARRAVTNFGRRYVAVGDSALQVAYPNDQGPAGRRAAMSAVRALVAAGVPRSAVVQGPYDVRTSDRSGLVLSFTAPTAISSGCPADWGDPTRDKQNTTPQRFGCTHQNNLAAMIDRPRDLIEPRALSPIHQGRRDVVLEAYQRGESTGSNASEGSTSTTE